MELKNINYVENKHYYLYEIDRKDADSMVKRYHYSGKVVNNSKLNLGVFDKVTGEMIGVLQYGYCMNPEKTPNKFVAGSTKHDMFELNRMAMADDAPKLCESQAIGLSIKWIKRFMPHIKWLLSYSDGKEGNFGIIYQATNWKYIGYLESSSFYKLNDDIIHRVTIYGRFKKKMKDDPRTELQILKDTFDSVSVVYCKQFIYVYPLDSKIIFTSDEQPYPKKGVDRGIIKERVYKKDGVVFDKFYDDYSVKEKK